MRVPLALGRGFAEVDETDFETVAPYRWHLDRGYAKAYGYRDERPCSFYMHRLILGLTDRRIVADHADGNGLNNRRSNLRICAQIKNCANQRRIKTGTSRFKGVYWSSQKGKWHAKVSPTGRAIHLGFFDREEDAASAYDQGVLNHFGAFAATNAEILNGSR